MLYFPFSETTPDEAHGDLFVARVAGNSMTWLIRQNLLFALTDVLQIRSQNWFKIAFQLFIRCHQFTRIQTLVYCEGGWGDTSSHPLGIRGHMDNNRLVLDNSANNCFVTVELLTYFVVNK